MYDYLIVGSGLYGAVFAHEMKKAGKSCLIIEKRDHIGGNIYTEKNEGINVHKYGAHIFHTNDDKVWEYINQFAVFNRYTNSPIANYKGEIYNMPFNMNTFNKMWGVITPAEAKAVIEKQKQEALKSLEGEPKNLEEQAISLVGTDIYEKLVKGYTGKQWGRACTELPAFIIKRLPVRFTYDNNYFNAKYQGIPIGGYTKMIEKLIGDTKVLLNTDYFEERDNLISMGKSEKLNIAAPCEKIIVEPEFYDRLCIAKKTVFTGAIDRFFEYRFGTLKYRSVRFETELLDTDNYQGNAVVNYTDSETPFTRIIEHKWFEFGKDEDGNDIEKTIISREYSKEWDKNEEPYYPVNDAENTALYEKYKKAGESRKDIVFGGRLGEYKYYDMDQVIAKALADVEKELGLQA